MRSGVRASSACWRAGVWRHKRGGTRVSGVRRPTWDAGVAGSATQGGAKAPICPRAQAQEPKTTQEPRPCHAAQGFPPELHGPARGGFAAPEAGLPGRPRCGPPAAIGGSCGRPAQPLSQLLPDSAARCWQAGHADPVQTRAAERWGIPTGDGAVMGGLDARGRLRRGLTLRRHRQVFRGQAPPHASRSGPAAA